jgi:hypothetical protein
VVSALPYGVVPVTPFVRWLKRVIEKLFGRWNETYEAPERLREMVVLFANMHPHATRADWLEFAAGHAAEAYRSGYIRGWERSERDAEAMPWATTSPEVIADEMDPDWRRGPSVLEGDAAAIVGENAPTAAELQAMQVKMLGGG